MTFNREEIEAIRLIIRQENSAIVDVLSRLSAALESEAKDQPKAQGEFVSSKYISHKLGIARATINKWQETRKFPLPIKIGNYCNRWRKAEVDLWIQENMTHGR